MDPRSLKALNIERRERRAAILLTALDGRADRIIREGDPVGGELGEAVNKAFRTGLSSTVTIDGQSWFLNVALPKPRIVVIGAVHISQALAPMAGVAGFDIEIIDPRTTSPLDEDTILESVERTGRLVVVDEATPRCSMATDIAALVADKAFDALKAPVRRVTAPHTPVPFAPSLEKLYIPDPQRIAAAVREVYDYRRS